MIIYNPRRCAGYIVLTSCKGSSFFKAMPLPFVATAFTLLIKLMPHIFKVPDTRAGDDVETETQLIDHPQASYALTSIVGFLLLFRSNLAYGRFWEGRTAVQNMGAAWAEVGSLVISFDSASKGRRDYAEWKADFVHLLSLMHALAVMSLRTDADLTNLVHHAPYQDFDGVTYASGDPWMSTQSSATEGDGSDSPRSGKPVAADDLDRSGSNGGGEGESGSATSIMTRAASVEADSSSKAPHMSPHARLRHRSGSRVERPPRPAPKTRQTGVVSRSGLSSRAHYFPIGVHNHLKQLHFISTPDSSPRPSTDPASLSPRLCKIQRSRSDSAGSHNRARGTADTADTVATSTAGTELGVSNGDSRVLRMQRSLTLGDLSTVRDVCDDLRVPTQIAAIDSTASVQLNLVLEHDTLRDDSRPRGHTAPVADLNVAEVDTNGDGKPDSTAFDTTGDGRFDAFDTNGDGKIDKIIVDVSRKPALAATETSNASAGGFEDGSNSANDLPSDTYDSRNNARGQQKSSTTTTFAEATEPTLQRNTYMDEHYLHQRLSKYNNTDAADNTSEASDLEPPRFPLMVIGGLWDSERERLAVVDPLHAERVYVVQSWIHHALVERYELEGLAVPAPLLAQVYAQISAGFSAFMQCKKLVDTPFPFPYAQIVLICLIILSTFLPIQVCIIVNSTPLAMILTFVTVWAFCSINEVAMELEEPFMDERNDIALADLHVDFSEKLLTLINRLTWRSSWPEGAPTSIQAATRGTTYTAPRHRLSRFASEEQEMMREAASATPATPAEAHAGGTEARP